MWFVCVFYMCTLLHGHTWPLILSYAAVIIATYTALMFMMSLSYIKKKTVEF